MKTMYPAQVNSPGTELAAAINAVQDTIQVTDGSVLPDGPNLLTIGMDEAAETILYTGKTGDELTGITRGFQGTAQSWAVGTKVARYFTAYDHDAAIDNIGELSTGLTAAKDRLDIEERKDVVLNAGMQILNAQRRAAFSLRGIKGRTLVNLIGRDGAFESVNPWSAYSVKGPPTVANNEITVIGSGEATNPQIGRNLRAAPAPKVGDKMFIRAIAKTKNACESLRTYLYISSPVGTRHGEIIISSPTVDKPYALYKSFTVTQQLVDNWGTTGLVLVAQHTSAAAATDTVAVYSQAALYVVATEDLGLTDDELAAKYTYVNSVQPVRNPYAIRYGENFASGYPTARINPSNSERIPTPNIQGAYEVKFTGEAVSQNVDKGVYFDVPALPGHSYTAAVDTLADNAFIRFEYFKDSDSISNSQWVKNPDFFPTNTTSIVTVPVGCSLIRVYITNQTTLYWNNGTLINESLIGGNYHFKNWRLFLGTKDLGFKPREDATLALQTDLFANPFTGENADEVFEKDGQYFKLAKWKNVKLDGSYDWMYVSPKTGYKCVRMPGLPNSRYFSSATASHLAQAVKYDGNILALGTVDEGGDKFQNSSNGYFYLNIYNSNSGWGDNYSPTADEIKAYFMGWRMFDGTEQGNPYNGTGVKTWKSIIGFRDSNVLPSTTLPTGMASAAYTPYQLVYQLATPTVEPIVSEGMLTFNEGDNQIEVGTGIVVRESTKPYGTATTGGTKVINYKFADIDTWLKCPLKKFVGIYRNGLLDPTWSIQPPGSAGRGLNFAQCYAENFDPSAAYSVTYLMLDTSPIVPFSGSYAANEKAMLQELTDAVQQNANAVSVLMNKKADKDQPGWIAPTLLNGWTAFNSNLNTAKIFKDSQGMIHFQGMVGTGVGGQPIFILPVGYRPSRTREAMTIGVMGGNVITSNIEVNPDGKVVPFGVTNPAWISLDSIVPFLAEK